MKRNIFERAFKTFIEAFFAFLIPQLISILNSGFPENGSKAGVLISPILCSSLAAGLSALGNSYQNRRDKIRDQQNITEIIDIEEE